MLIFVLLYNAGTSNEGIHTIEYGGCNTVLMFESGVGANYYVSLLEAYGFPRPTAELMDGEEIKKFCRNSGYDFRLITSDNVAIPPQKHKEKTDFQVNSKDTPLLEVSSSNLSSKQKEYYVISLREMYFLHKRNIADLQLNRALKGFSVEMNRQIEYYSEELQKIEAELQRWDKTWK